MSSTSGSPVSLLNRLYLEAAHELLLAHEANARLVEAGASGSGGVDRLVRQPVSQPVFASVQGATGEGIALASMLRIDRGFLIGVHPLRLADIEQPDLEDWCRELNNQLVGRLKNKLLGYRVEVTLGLPVLLSGIDVTMSPAPSAVVTEYFFESQTGGIALSLAAVIAPHIELMERESSEESGVLLEGAIAMFSS